jgi:hypothetical protein
MMSRWIATVGVNLRFDIIDTGSTRDDRVRAGCVYTAFIRGGDAPLSEGASGLLRHSDETLAAGDMTI